MMMFGTMKQKIDEDDDRLLSLSTTTTTGRKEKAVRVVKRKGNTVGTTTLIMLASVFFYSIGSIIHPMHDLWAYIPSYNNDSHISSRSLATTPTTTQTTTPTATATVAATTTITAAAAAATEETTIATVAATATVPSKQDHRPEQQFTNNVTAIVKSIQIGKQPKDGQQQQQQQQQLTSSPAIALLMSFPNSGTSYTLGFVIRSTNTSIASNYGKEMTSLDDEANSLPIDPGQDGGPYWPGMSGRKIPPRKLPEKFVITKTHCHGGLSVGSTYTQTTVSFLEDCVTSKPVVTSTSEQNFGERHEVKEMYSPDRIKKVIHLFRNPMDNIISRFHHERNRHKIGNEKTWLDQFSDTVDGFHKWCGSRRNDVHFRRQDMKYFGSESKIPTTPCHGEFIDWTTWHNLAHKSINLMRDGGGPSSGGGPKRKIPLLKLFYEDYNTNFDKITKSLLDFLELEQVYPDKTFHSKNYDEYFTENQLIDIETLVQSVATNNTWNDVKHYFDRDDRIESNGKKVA